MAALLELNGLYLLLAVIVIAVVTEKWRVMPFLAVVFATGLYGVAQGASPPWTAKEFTIGFGQAVASAGLTIVIAAMIARLAESAGALAWWHRRLAGRSGLAGLTGLAALAGLGGTPVAALAVVMPVIQACGAARARLALAASFAVNACHGCLVPSPLPIAALAILGGDWRYGLAFGLPVAIAQIGVGLALARRAPPGEDHAAPVVAAVPGGAWGGWSLIGLVAVMIALVIAQSLGQIPSEPLGGGTARENVLGLGRPMILAWVGLGGALLLFGGLNRRGLSEDGPVAQGGRAALGVLLAVGAAGGFQMILHNSGMSVVIAERVLELHPGFGIAIPFLVALVSRALQGSPLTAAIAAAGMMQPLLAPLGLASEAGRALTAVAIGAGAMAIPHVNDGYFWLASHLGGFRPVQGLRRVTGGALVQGATALAVLSLLALLRS